MLTVAVTPALMGAIGAKGSPSAVQGYDGGGVAGSTNASTQKPPQLTGFGSRACPKPRLRMVSVAVNYCPGPIRPGTLTLSIIRSGTPTVGVVTALAMVRPPGPLSWIMNVVVKASIASVNVSGRLTT